MNNQDNEVVSEQLKKKQGNLQLLIRMFLDFIRDNPLISIGITGITIVFSVTIIIQLGNQPSQPTPTFPTSCSVNGTGEEFDATTQPDQAPQSGCVLIVEWWVPPAPEPCGIIVTTESPIITAEAIGTWWLVNQNRVQSHIQEFLAKYDYCEVSNLLEA
jgi:hypothetical protein